MCVLLVVGFPTLCGILGMSVDMAHASLVAAIGTAAFVYLRTALDVSTWIALPGSILYLCHPLCVASVVKPTNPLAMLPMLLVPMVFITVWRALKSRGIATCVVLGALLGVGLALDRRSGALLLVVTGLYFFIEASLESEARAVLRRWKHGLSSVCLVAVVCTFVALALPGVAAQGGLALPTEDAFLDSSPSDITAPFALVDRKGLLASRLDVLPEGLTAGGGARYLGWTVIVFCLVAVWPSSGRGSRRSRRVAGLLILALGLAWFVRAPESLHSQLMRMFEFATLKRYVEPGTLHVLGLMIVPLALLAMTAFLAVGSLLRRGKHWTIGTVIVATFAVMAWWATSPMGLHPTAGRLVGMVLGTPTLPALWAFMLISGAAVGLHRACVSCNSRRNRSVLWLCALVLAAGDIAPYVRATLARSTSVPEETAMNAPLARPSRIERECAQASLDGPVKGLGQSTWCALPSLFSTLTCHHSVSTGRSACPLQQTSAPGAFQLDRGRFWADV